MQDNYFHYAATEVQSSFVTRFLIRAYQSFTNKNQTKPNLRRINILTYGNKH